MKAVFRHEFSSYFHNMTGYIFLAFLLFFAGIYSYIYNLQHGLANFEYVLQGMSFVFLIIIPVLTMKSIAEEKRQKTDQLLYSLPLNMTQVALGKYFAMLLLLLIAVAVISIYPLVLRLFGEVYLPTCYGAIIGFFFMGAALIAIGMFISSITDSQGIAAGLCFLVLLLNYFLSSLANYLPTTTASALIGFTVLVILVALIIWLMTRSWYAAALVGGVLEVVVIVLAIISPSWFATAFASTLGQLSLFERYNDFVNGIFNIKSLVFYITVSVLFVFLSIQSLDKRRWS